MEVAERELLAGERDVDDLVAQAPVELVAPERVLALTDRRLEPAANPVEQHACVAVAYAA